MALLPKAASFARLLALTLLCATSIASAQTTYFVRTTGSDSAKGTTAQDAFASVEHAAKVAKAGDTIVIGSGRYPGFVRFTTDATADKPIVVLADTDGSRTGDKGGVELRDSGSGAVRVEADHIHLRDLTITGISREAVRFNNAVGIRFERCTIIGGNRDAIYLPRQKNDLTIVDCVLHSGKRDLLQLSSGCTVTVLGSTFRDATGDGIRLNGGTVALSGTKLHDLKGDGIDAPSNTASAVKADRVHIYNTVQGIKLNRGELLVTGSLVHDVKGSGVYLGNNTPSAEVHNCTISRTKGHGIYLGKGKAVVRNTIVSETTGYAVEEHQNNSYSHKRSANLYWKNSKGTIGPRLGGGLVSGEVAGDPAFKDANGFALSANSAAIDKGTDPAGRVASTDMAGAARPYGDAWDIGAYEFSQSLKPADLPYANGFDKAPGEEWSENRRNAGRYTGGVHGQFYGVPANRESTVLAVKTVPGTTYEVEFDLILTGTWDISGSYKDVFYVEANGQSILQETFDAQGAARGTYKYRATLTGQDIDGVSGRDVQHAGMRATFVATHEVTRIVFRSETTGRDELYSLDNVEVREATPASGLVAHWTLDEDTGTVFADSSGRDLDLSIFGSLNLGVPAPFKLGVQGGESGIGYGLSPGVTSLSTPRGLTLSTWMRSPTAKWPSLHIPVYGANAYIYTVNGTNQLLSMFIDSTRTSRQVYTTLTDVDITQWTHYAARWDPRAAQFTVWVNGEKLSTLGVSSRNVLGLPSYSYAALSWLWNSNNATLGVEQDDTRIYDRPLSDEEIASLATLPGRFVDISDSAGFAVTTADNWEDPGSVLFGDLNSDGAIDAILTGTTQPRVMFNNGSGAFTPAHLGPTRASDQAALFDADHDGDLDLLTIGVNGLQNERIFFNDGRGTFTYSSATDWAGPINNEGLVLADIDGDGWCDATVFSANGNWISRHSGDPEEGLDTEPTRDPIDGLNDGGSTGNGDFAASGDINNDGKLDFFYHYNGGRLFLSNSDDSFSADNMGLSAYVSNTFKAGSEFADYDNDGDLDLFIADSRPGSTSSLWRHDGDRFTDVTTTSGIAFSGAHRSGTFGDIDNDGDLDLYVVSATDDPSRMYLNNGDGTFTYEPLDAPLNQTSLDALFADIDNDGDLDLAVSRTNAPASLLRNNSTEGESLRVRFTGSGSRRTNVAGVGVRLDLLTEDGTLLARRDLGLARGFGGQSPLVAHFGGIDPAATYTVRVHLRKGPIDLPVVPSEAISTFDGGRTVEQMLTIREDDIDTTVRVIRWQEVSAGDGD